MLITPMNFRQENKPTKKAESGSTGYISRVICRNTKETKKAEDVTKEDV